MSEVLISIVSSISLLAVGVYCGFKIAETVWHSKEQGMRHEIYRAILNRKEPECMTDWVPVDKEGRLIDELAPKQETREE